jgi:hypothetical protein
VHADIKGLNKTRLSVPEEIDNVFFCTVFVKGFLIKPFFYEGYFLWVVDSLIQLISDAAALLVGPCHQRMKALLKLINLSISGNKPGDAYQLGFIRSLIHIHPSIYLSLLSSPRSPEARLCG